MHDPKKRQRDLLKRTMTYIFMTLAVVVLVAVSLFLVLGYSVDKEGQAEQGGLVQFRSFPTGATVRVDGAKLSNTTNNKANTSAGFHNATMELKKYRKWSKDFTLKSGELLWLNALFIPQKITTEEPVSFEQVHSMKFSPDKKWLAVVENPKEAKIKLVDLRDEKKPVVSDIILPTSVTKLLGGDGSYEVSEWDFGSKYMLVKYTVGSKIDWLRMDRSEAENTKNVSTLEGISIQDAHFVGTGGNIFYVLSDGFVRKVDISRQDEEARNVAENVKEFELYKDDQVVFVALNGDKQQVGAYDESQNKSQIVREFPAEATNVHTSMSSYFNDDYQAISQNGLVEIVKNPLEERKLFAKFKVSGGAQWLFFSNNGRFVVSQTGSNLSTYDLERKQNFNFAIPGNPTFTLPRHLKWLDDYHMVSDAGGLLNIFEYDGTNAQEIGSVATGGDISLSDNGKRLFYLGTNASTGKPVLQSTIMVIE